MGGDPFYLKFWVKVTALCNEIGYGRNRVECGAGVTENDGAGAGSEAGGRGAGTERGAD